MYLTAIKFGNQQFYSVIDTGSSDTWIIDAGFRCTIPRTAQPGPNNCGFGPGYKKTSTFSQNKPAQKFSISYSGEHVEGIAGTETVTFGNIPVLNQQVAVVNSGVWKGDGISSGLIGLAFPSNSAVWTEMAASREPYSPIFTSMYRKGLVAPYFSIALNRGNESPGVLALGGLPGAPIRYSNKFARAPFQYLTFGDSDPSKKPAGDFDYRLYRITIDGFSVNAQPSSVDKKRAQVSVDSGTAVLVLPSDVAKAFNAGWKPAAQYDRIQGWRVECTAKPPKFGVKLNGTTFWIDGMDLVVPREPGAPGSLCSSGVQEAKWPGGAMLGSIFLKNVLAVFDIGAAELRFADRLR